MKKIIISVVVLIAIIIIGYVGYVWYQGPLCCDNDTQPNYKDMLKENGVYKNERYGFSFEHPSKYVIEESADSIKLKGLDGFGVKIVPANNYVFDVASDIGKYVFLPEKNIWFDLDTERNICSFKYGYANVNYSPEGKDYKWSHFGMGDACAVNYEKVVVAPDGNLIVLGNLSDCDTTKEKMELREKIINSFQIDNTRDGVCSYQGDSEEFIIRDKAKNILKAIKDKDIKTLSSYVHPLEGTRFSQDGVVWLENDIVLKPTELESAYSNSFIWGHADGSGFPIQKTFSDYLGSYLGADYLNQATSSYNKILRGGSTSQNNLEAKYSGKNFVSFYIPSTSTYISEDGKSVDNPMSWTSVNLVFDRLNGQKWYLIGIVKDNWTI
jgi:hypothetical protein